MTDELKCKDWTTYAEKSAVTAIYKHRGEFLGLLYVASGLVDESFELFEVLGDHEKSIKECSDNFWFGAQMCYELGIYIEDIVKESEELKPQFKTYYMMEAIHQVIGPACKICGILSKSMRDDNFKLTEEKKIKIRFQLACAFCGFYNVCKMLGVNWQYVAQKNLEKLYSRMERGKLGGSGDNR